MGLYLFGGGDDRDREFAAYYSATGARMRTTAFLLCGDWHLAEDLTQIAFTKLYRSWRRVNHHEVLDQYVRRIVVRAFLDERRRPWRREFTAGPADAGLDRAVEGPDVAERLALSAALADLPARERAVLVLRFWEDLSIEQVAEMLALPAGTVKSQTARGLARLRARLDRESTDRSRPMGEKR
ncbi:SigE family RNA polymerase sigma factor [Plantactinospora sp. B5E13]|uniref:SigE family RNA polymerase sigma factor n=1 Tax=unclassified Plantactinospora TaxID=2631981 RepID=UPI00325EC587